MTKAICIASYKSPDFLELNVRQCTAIFPDAPILVSDDLSAESPTIKALADRLSCAYSVTESRRGRCGGWIQALVNGLSFAEQESAEVMLLLGQRFVPSSPKFADTVLDQFQSNQVGAVTFERPAEFMALRVGLISPDEVLERYRVAMRLGRYHPDVSIPSFSEHLVTTLKKHHVQPVLDGSFQSQSPTSGQYLSHKTSTSADFIAFAALRGVSGQFDCGSWAMREKEAYLGRAEAV